MRLHPIVALVVCFMFSGISVAQESLPTPPALADIFAPNVVVEYRQSGGAPSAYPIDAERRVFFDGEKEVSFPSDFEIRNVFRIDDNRLGILRRTGEYEFKVYAYDTASGEFYLFESPCMPDSNSNGFYSEDDFNLQPWSLTISEDTSAVLCNRVTGEKSETLPAEYTYLIFNDYRGDEPLFQTSPDGQFIVFFGMYEVPENLLGENRHLVLLSYEVATGEVRKLADLEYDSYQSFYQWVGHLVFISLSSDTSNVGGYGIVIADVTKADSWTGAFGYNMDTRITFEENPPRFVAHEACGESVIYDVTTRSKPETKFIPVPTVAGEPTRIPWERDYRTCKPDYISDSGLYYYRGVTLGYVTECCGPPPIDGGEAALISNGNVLYTDEIEQIWWVSDDQRLALLTIDNDGGIDHNPFDDYFLSGWMEAPEITLIDLSTGDILGTDPYFYSHGQTFLTPRHLNRPIGDILPLNQNEILVVTSDEMGTKAISMSSQDGSIVEKDFPDICPLALTPDWGHVMVKHYIDSIVKCSGSQFDLLNVETGEIQVFIPEPESAFSYHLSSYQLFTDLAPNAVSTKRWRLTVSQNNPDGSRTELARHEFDLSIREDGTPIVTLDGV